MPVLSTQQLDALAKIVREEKLRGEHPRYQGHVLDLLETIKFVKKEKKKWQRLAQARGEALLTIKYNTNKSTLQLDKKSK